RMALLLLYHLLVVFVPSILLLVQCSGKKKNAQKEETGRSVASQLGTQKQPLSDGARMALDHTGRETGEAANDPNNAGLNKSCRISIHGTVHNTDTYASAEQVDGDGRAPSIEAADHINMDKAAPGKVVIDASIDKVEKTVEKVEKTQGDKSNGIAVPKPNVEKTKIDSTQVDKTKSEQKRVEMTQKTLSAKEIAAK
ncbi:hypothetical protein PFISCL1PPCAC_14164, partial [Pristionchus fissidentatus]